jgi:SPP1 family phage portal protein
MKFVKSSSNDINPENLKDWIDSFRRDIQPKLLALDSFYKGIDKIDKGKQRTEDRPDNKIHSNLAKMIVKNATSYFVGKPVTYAFNDNKANKELIEDTLFNNSENQENKRLAIDLSKYGVAYELAGVGMDKLIYFKRIDPLSTFLVVDDTILQNPICVVSYYGVTDSKTKQTKIKGWVYDADYIQSFESDDRLTSMRLTDGEINPFHPKVPVTVFQNNSDMTGDYEDVTELLTAYSRLLSNNFDDVEGILNAVLVFYETKLNDEDGKKMNKTRVVQLVSEQGEKPARAEFLSKQLDKEYVEYLRNFIREDIFSISNVPDFTDDDFAGNQSGVALGYKLIGFENLRLDKESYFESGLFNRIELILTYKQFREVIVGRDDIKITFYANLPANIDKDDKIADLYNKGVISLKTAVDSMEIVKDKDGELELIEDERPSLEKMNGQ